MPGIQPLPDLLLSLSTRYLQARPLYLPLAASILSCLVLTLLSSLPHCLSASLSLSVCSQSLSLVITILKRPLYLFNTLLLPPPLLVSGFCSARLLPLPTSVRARTSSSRRVPPPALIAPFSNAIRCHSTFLSWSLAFCRPSFCL
ncbi:hypothetical protein K431DRAFT_81875 [Polychaeton citri CBS 116435]|uniref:Uncharacterized protein n=1 Tax=Polychaeton citri CBS 116435 TaxID=1314669 RepID=A0A9P4QG67_9PEZI|nr:hypothetical protein K431DRAFT_81875 [Polychaeton citri CBS 116435]